MERLNFGEGTLYTAIETSMYLNRYLMAKPFCNEKKVLDAACGTGYGSYLLKSWGADIVYGLDTDINAIKNAKHIFKESNLFFQTCNIEQLPFNDNEFDVVVSLETIEHLDNLEGFLQEIKRVLKPDGVVILSYPNNNYSKEDSINNSFYKSVYSFYEFKQIAESVLGNQVSYFSTFALDGFITVPFEQCVEPETKKTKNSFDFFYNVQCENVMNVICVSQEKYFNQWNSDCFVCIWGNHEYAMKYSAVITPRETHINYQDKDYELISISSDVQGGIFQSDNNDIEKERLLALLEIARKERDIALNCDFGKMNKIKTKGKQFLRKVKKYLGKIKGYLRKVNSEK